MEFSIVNLDLATRSVEQTDDLVEATPGAGISADGVHFLDGDIYFGKSDFVGDIAGASITAIASSTTLGEEDVEVRISRLVNGVMTDAIYFSPDGNHQLVGNLNVKDPDNTASWRPGLLFERGTGAGVGGGIYTYSDLANGIYALGFSSDGGVTHGLQVVDTEVRTNKHFIANFNYLDADFKIRKLTSGDAYVYDAGAATHYYYDRVLQEVRKTDENLGYAARFVHYSKTTQSGVYSVYGSLNSESRPSVASGVTNSGVIAAYQATCFRNYYVDDDNGTLSVIYGNKTAVGHSNIDPADSPSTTNVFGYHTTTNGQTGIITNSYDYYAADCSVTGSGVITNRFGLYIVGESKKHVLQGETIVNKFVQKPAASVTPANNGELVVEATSNTQLTFRLKGTDGVVRSGTMTLS